MSKDDLDHGALHEAVDTLKSGHIRLEAKIDGFREAVFVKDEAHNKRREDRDREVDAKFSRVDIKLITVGIISAISPFAATGIMYPEEAIKLVSALYHLFV